MQDQDQTPQTVTIGPYEVRFDDEETLQYEVVQAASGDLLALLPSQSEAIEYAKKQVIIDQARSQSPE